MREFREKKKNEAGRKSVSSTCGATEKNGVGIVASTLKHVHLETEKAMLLLSSFKPGGALILKA